MEQTKEQSQVESKTPAQLDGKNENHSVACYHGGLETLNLFDEKQCAAAEFMLQKIMRSDKGGIKSVNDGLAILMRAQDLGLPFSTCIEHIHVINGKTGIDIHIAKALLSKAGVTWSCLKDYTPLYEYTDGINVYTDGNLPEYAIRCKSQKDAEEKSNKAGIDSENVYVYPVKWYQDFSGNQYKEYQLNNKQYGIVNNRTQIPIVTKEGKIPVYRIPAKPVDYITEYEFHRNLKGTNITSKGRFTYSEAVQAKLFEKDTYVSYSRIMIGHRAFIFGARDIASDILFGVMETQELKLSTNTPLNKSDLVDISEDNTIKDVDISDDTI